MASRINGVRRSLGVFIGAATLLSSLSAAAQDAADFSGRWSTDYGLMHLRQRDDDVRGRYDFNGGRLRGQVEDRDLSGVWVQDTSDRRCDEERMGSPYWGRVEFHMSRDRDRFWGRWGYCNENPSRSWNGRR